MNISQITQSFEKNKYIQAKDFLSKEFCHFLTHVLLRRSADPTGKKISGRSGDEQVPDAIAVMDHEILFETVLERLWPEIEIITGKELIPTYAYSRLYINGNILNEHVDRPECEISVTIQLGRSHHYSWPIWMENTRIDLAEGDGIIYKGCEIDHRRDACDGPPGYYSGQLFLHFVDANGPYKDRYADNHYRSIYSNMFVKNRAIIMDQK